MKVKMAVEIFKNCISFGGMADVLNLFVEDSLDVVAIGVIWESGVMRWQVFIGRLSFLRIVPSGSWFEVGDADNRVDLPVSRDVKLISETAHAFEDLKTAHVALCKFRGFELTYRDVISVAETDVDYVARFEVHRLVFSIVVTFH